MNLQGTRASQVVDVDVIRVAVCTHVRVISIAAACIERAACARSRGSASERGFSSLFGVGAFARD